MTRKAEAARAKLLRLRDQRDRLRAQMSDVRLAAGVQMNVLLGEGESKTDLAATWKTSRGQADKMMERAKVEGE